MSAVPSFDIPEETGKRYIPVHCIVEHIEPSTDHGVKPVSNCRREVDTVVRLPGQCPYDEIVITALQKLGYSTHDMTGAKGSLQFPNWNSLSCDAVTDDLEATVESILGGVASLVTLRIRLQSRSKFSDQDGVKEKLFTFLLQRLQSVLNNTGCPINQTLLNEISDGDFVHGSPSPTHQAFDRWFRDQLEHPNNHHQTPPNHNNGSSENLNDPATKVILPRSNDHTRDALPKVTRAWSVQDPVSSPGSPKDGPVRDWSWRESDSRTLGRSGGFEPEEETNRNGGSGSRIRILPNRNAVYEADADLPTIPSPPETELVVVVTPEMPNADEDDGLPVCSSATYQNEPTDLSVRRDNPETAEDEIGINTGSHRSATSPDYPKPFGMLNGGGVVIDSRPPSPHPHPPSLTGGIYSSHPGFQNHLVHLHQQQQQALQLAAMSRTLNFHFGGIHPLKVLSRGPGADRPPFPYGGVPTAPLPPNGMSSLNHHPDKSIQKDQKKRSRVFIDPLTEIPKLERWFAEDTHPSSYVIEKFTDELNRAPYRQRFPKLEPKNLQLWFKNHRAKMKRHRDVIPAHHVTTAGHVGGNNTPRTPSPRSFYADWADRCPVQGFGGAVGGGGVMMTSSCSPSSSTGSRIMVSSPVPEVKSGSDCSDGDMDADDLDEGSQKDTDD